MTRISHRSYILLVVFSILGIIVFSNYQLLYTLDGSIYQSITETTILLLSDEPDSVRSDLSLPTTHVPSSPPIPTPTTTNESSSLQNSSSNAGTTTSIETIETLVSNQTFQDSPPVDMTTVIVVPTTKPPIQNESFTIQQDEERNNISNNNHNNNSTLSSSDSVFKIPDSNTTFQSRCNSSLHTLSNSSSPLGIFVLPESFDDIVELHHFILEGINYSPCLYREMDPFKANVWVYDRHRGYCEYHTYFQDKVQQRKQQLNHTTTTTMSTPWKIYFIDFVDGPNLRPCDNLIPIINEDPMSEIIHLKRSIVADRTGLNHTGHLLDYGPEHKVIHIPYGVRSDLVHMVQKEVVDMIRNSNATTTTGLFPNEELYALPEDTIISFPICPVDIRGRIGGVRNFWHHPSNKCIYTNPYFECHNGVAREQVADTLLEMESKIILALQSNTSLSIHGERVTDKSKASVIQLSGSGNFQGEEGRQRSSREYAMDLLTYRIVVVTQRDLHEDHYRLMEAFVGGALVLTDLMLAPPKRLVDGQHYVVYRSLKELEEKVLYYLSHEEERRQVALAGWTLVMQHYRSWHLMESLLLREEEP